MNHRYTILKAMCILFLFLINVEVHAQELKEKQLRTLSSLGLPYENFDLANAKINTDFRNILKLEKRRKGQKIAGSILLPLGVALAGLGVSMISTFKKSYRHAVDGPYGPESGEYGMHPLHSAIGSGLVVIGSAQIAISIPMFIGSGSKKRKQDRLLSKYREGVKGD